MFKKGSTVLCLTSVLMNKDDDFVVEVYFYIFLYSLLIIFCNINILFCRSRQLLVSLMLADLLMYCCHLNKVIKKTFPDQSETWNAMGEFLLTAKGLNTIEQAKIHLGSTDSDEVN